MELWDAYLQDGTPAHQTLVRGEPIPAGLYHLVADVLVMHEDGTFLLMQRDPHKENWPGVFEPTAGGSALKGETPLEAARRELAEETGITRGVFTPLFSDTGMTTIYEGFLCRTDWPKEEIALQPGETVAYRWVSRAQLCAMMDEKPVTVVVQPGTRAWLCGAQAPVRLRLDKPV